MDTERIINTFLKNYPGYRVDTVRIVKGRYIFEAYSPKCKGTDEMDPFYSMDPLTGEIKNFLPMGTNFFSTKPIYVRSQ